MKKINLKTINILSLLICLFLFSACGFSPSPCNCLEAQASNDNEKIKACEVKFQKLSFQERADWINDLDNCKVK
jgi:hypothetical protein